MANLWFGWKLTPAGGRAVDAGAYGLAALSVMGLALCRDRPRAALVVVGVALISYSRLGYPSHPGQFAVVLVFFLAFVRGARWEAAVLSALASVATVIIGPGLVSDTTIENLGRIQLFLIPAAPLLAGYFVWVSQERVCRLQEQAVLSAREREARIARDSAKQLVGIARDLHDTLGHQIAVISVQSGAALTVLDTDPETTREALVAINESCRNVITETKHILAALRGDGSSSAPALESTIMTAHDIGLELELTQSGTLDHVDRRVVETVNRLAQESLTNTLKHANAASIDIVLEVDAKVVRFAFTDDGKTNNPGYLSGKAGSGLRGMADRVAELGGSFKAGPTPKGFLVSAELPASVGAAQ